ncbi:MAG TPA: nuclease-related domain-containing protein [Prosthecobacter sp.]
MFDQVLIPILYFVVVLGGCFAISLWKLTRQPTRRPLGEDILLRRQPGEHLRVQFSKAWESLVLKGMGRLVLLPCVVFLGVSFAGKQLLNLSPLIHLVLLVVSPVACIIYGGVRLYGDLRKITNLRLGLFGERAVADQLEGLKQKGYEVFHDVPCVGGSGPFNLDHVVVGKGVVVVVETKTLRKPKDVKDGHKVTYNGQVLTWPSGATSTRELEQALRNAEWLRKELKKQANVEATVHAALTFPGWFVNGGPPQAPVLVVSHKSLPNFIEKRFPPHLSPGETDAVVRHLNLLCTNLSYADVE